MHSNNPRLGMKFFRYFNMLIVGVANLNDENHYLVTLMSREVQGKFKRGNGKSKPMGKYFLCGILNH